MGTLWKIELNMAPIIAYLYGFHGDMGVPCTKYAIYHQSNTILTPLCFHFYIIHMCVNIIGALLRA